MSDAELLVYAIKEPVELNLSYMPFINGGGLFVPTAQSFLLGAKVVIELHLPEKKDSLKIEGKVVWITPGNALHHVVAGVGIQFTGVNAAAVRTQIEASLDASMEIGGYTYGIIGERGVKKIN